jgi:tetratricopeptide (TPR) repeat protein
VRCTRTFAAAVVALGLMGGLSSAADQRRPLKEMPSFGVLKGLTPEEAKAQSLAWLKAAGKTDAASQQAFEAIWQADRTLLDKVSATLALGEPAAKKLLDEARDPDAPAPTALPEVLKDLKTTVFFRANLSLAYAKALAGRRVYEEALNALAAVKAEDVVDPAAYLFYRAVAEHALMLKDQAQDTIDRLLVDVVESPERYRMVAALMHFDMLTWRDKDLGWISRKMGVIKDRLDIVRGGPKTQKMQKEVLVRLDEMIKEMENKAKGSCNCNGGNCPNGAPKDGPGSLQPGSPMQDSNPQNGQQGKGEVDPKKVKEIAEVWGKLPEKERAKAMVELTRGMPPKYREAIETYLKQLNGKSGAR